MSAGTATPFPRLDCTHAEADDRLMFHVQDILSQRSEHTTIILLSGDTDVLYDYYTISQSIGEFLASKSSGSFAIQG